MKYRFRYSRFTREPEALNFDQVQRARQGCWELNPFEQQGTKFLFHVVSRIRSQSNKQMQRTGTVPFSALIAEYQKEKAVRRKFSSQSVLATEAHCKDKGGLRRAKFPPPAFPTQSMVTQASLSYEAYQSRDLT